MAGGSAVMSLSVDSCWSSLFVFHGRGAVSSLLLILLSFKIEFLKIPAQIKELKVSFLNSTIMQNNNEVICFLRSKAIWILDHDYEYVKNVNKLQ